MEKIKSKQEGSKQIDWAGINKEYRAGQLSNVEIGKRFGVSEGGIRRRAKKEGWNKDLSDAVRKMVREKLVRTEVRRDNAKKVPDEEIIDEASDRWLEVATLHRADIKRLRTMEQDILRELGDKETPPTKLHVCQYQGDVIETPVKIPVTERAAALNNLANVQHKRIALERTAWNLDEIDRSADKCLIVLN